MAVRSPQRPRSCLRSSHSVVGMKSRVPDMAHDSADERPSDIGLLRSGAGNREEKAITKAPKTRKHEHALVQHQSFYGQGRCIEVEEQADSRTRRPEVGSKLSIVHVTQPINRF